MLGNRSRWGVVWSERPCSCLCLFRWESSAIGPRGAFFSFWSFSAFFAVASKRFFAANGELCSAFAARSGLTGEAGGGDAFAVGPVFTGWATRARGTLGTYGSCGTGSARGSRSAVLGFELREYARLDLFRRGDRIMLSSAACAARHRKDQSECHRDIRITQSVSNSFNHLSTPISFVSSRLRIV